MTTTPPLNRTMFDVRSMDEPNAPLLGFEEGKAVHVPLTAKMLRAALAAAAPQSDGTDTNAGMEAALAHLRSLDAGKVGPRFANYIVVTDGPGAAERFSAHLAGVLASHAEAHGNVGTALLALADVVSEEPKQKP
ncbi:MAG TPA: hypothetical protein VLC93_02025 [Myxococcota bacterium]|nr:hypothetical protein [Myxococcota bacterium]